VDLQTAVAISMLPASRGRASALFKELRQQHPAASLRDVAGALGLVADGVAAEAWRGAELALAAATAAGIEPVPWFDARYPPLLACIIDPPPILWTRGDVGILNRPTVAIVGSRAATPYALDVGARLAAELADRDVVVVSGLARGVDSAAHRGCLDAGGLTVAVLGSGLDRVYPSEHVELADRIARKGLVVSELGPGGAPLPEHFPLRNRIISGISLAVVVVEASDKSGSLITARCALDQGREVMAVPGSVLSGRNRGSHSLLKDGAKVVETADDILQDLWPGWQGLAPTPPAVDGGSLEPRKFLKEDPLLAHMEVGESYELDRLVVATGLAPSRLLTRLMELELKGDVASRGGGRFSRTATRRG
jgi:DNA processing protein